MRITTIEKYGDSLAVLIDDGTRVIAYPVNTMWIPMLNDYGIKYIEMYGNSLLIRADDDNNILAHSANGVDIWFAELNDIGGTPPVASLIDTIWPGHSITNPGGTIASGWQWHLDNNGDRGGVDFNYNFQNFTAPGAGTVDHFDVTSVGMVVRLILDTPADRINPQLTNDAYGPMTAIWFQHCSDSFDGPVSQGDVIGTSGNGYGDYGAHLHVHGMINNGGSAPSSARCNFWGFV